MTFNQFERTHAEGFYTKQDIKAIYALQNGECHYCGTKLGPIHEKNAYQIDHIVPITKDGTNWPGNLALTCALCNKRKHNHSTNILWSKLREEKGNDWVKSKVLSNKKITPLKTKLTRARKAERAKSLDMLKQEIEVAVSRNIKKLNFHIPNDIDISVNQCTCYLDIWFNNSSITLPAPTQNRLESWHVTEYDTLAVSLINIEYLSGYLKNA